MTTAEVTLPAAVSSVPTARHFVESILTGWGKTDLAWTATLLVSELAANAALHARGQSFTIRVTDEHGSVRLEVADGSRRLPQQRAYANDATTGRGLRLVGELAAAWGVTPQDGGKTVWALLLDRDVSGDDEEADVDVDALLSAFTDDDPDPAPVSELRGPVLLDLSLAPAA